MSVERNFFISGDLEPHAQRHLEIEKIYGEKIKNLYGHNPISFLFIVCIMGTQLGLAFLIKDKPWYVLLLTSYFIGAFLNHALYVFLHEATHNLIFKTTFANRLVGMICDWFLIFPGAMAFRKYHLMHHGHMGEYQRDADIPSRLEARMVGKSRFLKAFWSSTLGIFQALRPVRFKQDDLLDKWVIFNFLSQLTVITLLYFLVGVPGILYFLASTFFCLGLHPLGGRWIAEHYTADSSQETFSYYGPVNKLMFNIGHHNEHHDFMGVPWNHLPKIKEIAPEYYDSLKSHSSYTKVLWNFIMKSDLTLYSRVMRAEKGLLKTEATQGTDSKINGKETKNDP